MPQLAKDCIASWHKYMPDWEYKLWNEDNFDVNSVTYVKEAYEARKFAFVSDYVRLYALVHDGGVYLDVDFEVYKSFSPLLSDKAFAGFEGSKTNPLMMGVIASEPSGLWVSEQIGFYEQRHFYAADGTMDMTTNVRFVTDQMMRSGFVANGEEQYYLDLHIYPVEYFCPRKTSGEYMRTDSTYCEHKGLGSWNRWSMKKFILNLFSEKTRITIIKIKRKLLG